MNSQKQQQNAAVARRSIGVQCEVMQKEYIPARVQATFFQEADSFLYRSHNITIMLVMLVCLYIFSLYFEGDTMYESAKRGYIFAILGFCTFGTIYFPNTMIQRPHPAFWRLLQSWGCCYLMSVVFCLFLFLSLFIDPRLGKPLAEKSYAEDCRIYTPENKESSFYNLENSMDIFVAAHVFGWTLKMLILRDFKLAMIQQVVFEFMEITFRHWLPNFWECWWDHIILDIIVCNTGGILFGSWLIKKFKMTEYKWSLRQDKQLTYWQNVKHLCLNPQLDEHEWQVFSSPKRFLSVIWFMILMNLCDLSYFFNKFILWIEPSHAIMKFRAFPLGLLSISGAREYYIYITNDNVTRMGPNSWLIHMIILSEWLLFFKNYDGIPRSFTAAFPTYVIILWIIIAILFLNCMAFLFLKERKIKKVE